MELVCLAYKFYECEDSLLRTWRPRFCAMAALASTLLLPPIHAVSPTCYTPPPCRLPQQQGYAEQPLCGAVRADGGHSVCAVYLYHGLRSGAKEGGASRRRGAAARTATALHPATAHPLVPHTPERSAQSCPPPRLLTSSRRPRGCRPAGPRSNAGRGTTVLRICASSLAPISDGGGAFSLGMQRKMKRPAALLNRRRCRHCRSGGGEARRKACVFAARALVQHPVFRFAAHHATPRLHLQVCASAATTPEKDILAAVRGGLGTGSGRVWLQLSEAAAAPISAVWALLPGACRCRSALDEAGAASKPQKGAQPHRDVVVDFKGIHRMLIDRGLWTSAFLFVSRCVSYGASCPCSLKSLALCSPQPICSSNE